MRRSFSLKFNLFDIIVIALSFVLTISLIIVNNVVFDKNIDMDSKACYVYYDSVRLDEFTVYFKDLEDEEVKEIVLLKERFPKLLMDMVILVSKKDGIKVEEEDSPQHICSRQGWVEQVDFPLFCLPNSVYVIIQDLNKVDIDIPLG